MQSWTAFFIVIFLTKWGSLGTGCHKREHGSWEYSWKVYTGKFLLHFTNGQKCNQVDLQLQESLSKEKSPSRHICCHMWSGRSSSFSSWCEMNKLKGIFFTAGHQRHFLWFPNILPECDVSVGFQNKALEKQSACWHVSNILSGKHRFLWLAFSLCFTSYPSPQERVGKLVA